jgi:hypothetical protein
MSITSEMQNIPNRSPLAAWKVGVVAVCFSVFLFGLHAKLVLYDPPSPGVTAVASAKLWNGNQKMEVQTSLQFVLIAWLSTLLIFGLHVARFERLRSDQETLPQQVKALGLHRFFRPPPSRA